MWGSDKHRPVCGYPGQKKTAAGTTVPPSQVPLQTQLSHPALSQKTGLRRGGVKEVCPRSTLRSVLSYGCRC